MVTRITIQFESDGYSPGGIAMAEEWLKRLAAQIKEKDHVVAEETARAEHELRLIKEHGPVLWRGLADFLSKYVEDMKVDFHDDITLREGQLGFGFNQGNSQIGISKAAFPYVQFTASPNYQARAASIAYISRNPKLEGGSAAIHTPMPCRFEVTHDNKVYLNLDGKPFHEAQEAAKYIMEKLFTVA